MQEIPDGAERKQQSSPGDTLLANAAGMQVAVLGQPCGPTVLHGLIAEAASEARGTRAMLAHSPAARAVVTKTMNTATVCRKETGAEKEAGIRTGWEPGLVLQWVEDGAASTEVTLVLQTQRSFQIQWAGR